MINLCEPYLTGNEWQYVEDCLDTRMLAIGRYIELFEEAIAIYTEAEYAVATSSGTAALHISLLVCGIKPSDLVMIPDLTFVATSNAVKYVNAHALLIDVDDNWQMDLDLLEQEVKRYKPKAVIIVHLLGSMCDMQRLLSICNKHSVKLIEDAAGALGSFQGKDVGSFKHAGTIGDVGCISFNGNKIITAGNGGMIITNDKELANKVRHLINQAKGKDFYHDEVGYNYRISNIHAAIGLAQFENLSAVLLKKRKIFELYDKLLEGIKKPAFNGNNWQYAITVKNRDSLINRLANAHIQASPVWQPLHTLPMYEMHASLKNSKKISDSSLFLPSHPNLKDSEIEHICKTVNDFDNKV